MSDTVMVYAIHWAKQNVLKVGVARTMSRVRALTSTGGRVLLLMRDCPVWEERAALEALAAEFPRAFATEQSSVSVLPRGRGFTECFTVTGHELERAIKTIFRGIAAHASQQAETNAPAPVERRDVARDRRRTLPHDDGLTDAGGRSRARDMHRLDGAPRPVQGPTTGDRGDAGRALPAVARPGGDRHLLRRRQVVLRDEGVAFRVASSTVEVPPAAARTLPAVRWIGSRRLLGLGEGGRERGSEYRGDHLGHFQRSSVSVLSGSSAFGYAGGLQALRYSTVGGSGVGEGTTQGSGSGVTQ